MVMLVIVILKLLIMMPLMMMYEKKKKTAPVAIAYVTLTQRIVAYCQTVQFFFNQSWADR